MTPLQRHQLQRYKKHIQAYLEYLDLRARHCPAERLRRRYCLRTLEHIKTQGF